MPKKFVCFQPQQRRPPFDWFGSLHCVSFTIGGGWRCRCYRLSPKKQTLNHNLRLAALSNLRPVAMFWTGIALRDKAPLLRGDADGCLGAMRQQWLRSLVAEISAYSISHNFRNETRSAFRRPINFHETKLSAFQLFVEEIIDSADSAARC